MLGSLFECGQVGRILDSPPLPDRRGRRFCMPTKSIPLVCPRLLDPFHKAGQVVPSGTSTRETPCSFYGQRHVGKPSEAVNSPTASRSRKCLQ